MRERGIMLITQEDINNLSLKEWGSDTQKEREEFEEINKQIEELYPKSGHVGKGGHGEGSVQLIVDNPKNIGWQFRKQHEGDYGIDAHFEIIENGNVTGRLIAAQIKCGKSYVKEYDDHFVYYGKFKHLLYWLEHSLPVIVVYVEENDDVSRVPTCYWVEVKKEKIKTLKESWKIRIPKEQILHKDCIDKLSEVSPEKSISDLRVTELRLQRPLMEHLYNGGKIAIEFKGAKEPRITIENQNGSLVDTLCWKNMFSTALFSRKLPDFIFPWADIDLNVGFDLTSEEKEEVEQTPEEINVIRNADFNPEDFKSGGTFKIYLELNSFGIDFLELSNYLANGISNTRLKISKWDHRMKIGELRKSIQTAINLMNLSKLSDEDIANSIEMDIKSIQTIHKIKDGDISVKEVAKVFGVNVKNVPLLHDSFKNE
ncbi:hypothetical protein CN394_11050 [Bacillus anthracis]|nr:hypothetical protein CN394_11050 [Bacillus anthracis]PEZ79980.1 hypothetical protein CN410_02505 [Bacillus anthracis]